MSDSVDFDGYCAAFQRERYALTGGAMGPAERLLENLKAIEFLVEEKAVLPIGQWEALLKHRRTDAEHIIEALETILPKEKHWLFDAERDSHGHPLLNEQQAQRFVELATSEEVFTGEERVVPFASSKLAEQEGRIHLGEQRHAARRSHRIEIDACRECPFNHFGFPVWCRHPGTAIGPEAEDPSPGLGEPPPASCPLHGSVTLIAGPRS